MQLHLTSSAPVLECMVAHTSTPVSVMFYIHVVTISRYFADSGAASSVLQASGALSPHQNIEELTDDSEYKDVPVTPTLDTK